MTTNDRINLITVYTLTHTPEQCNKELRLTNSMRETMALLAYSTVKEIASKRNLKEKTVAAQIKDIYRKVRFAEQREKANAGAPEKPEQPETPEKPEHRSNRFTENFKSLALVYNYSQDWESMRDSLIQNCAESIALSVLRKLESVGGQNAQMMRDMQIDIIRDREHDREREHYLSDMYKTVYNENGDKLRVVKDGYDETTASALCGENYGDGTNLVHVATLEILEQVARQRERGEMVDFERRYTVRELSKKVMIKTSENAIRERETFPIREIFRKVRETIGDSASIKVTSAIGYSYIKREFTDNESGERLTAYERGEHYSDIGGEQIHRIGDTSASAVYTADEYTFDEIGGILAGLNLTAKQSAILRKRLQGYGVKAIATSLGVNKKTVQEHLKAIQVKAIKAGLTVGKSLA